MKNTFIALSLCIVSSYSLQAQEYPKQKRHRKEIQEKAIHCRPRNLHAKKQFFKNATAEQIATIQTKKQVLALDLSPKQQQQLYTVFLERATLAKRIKKTPDSINFTNYNAALDRKIAMQKKIRAILSPEQYALWKEKKQERIKKRKKSCGKKH